ncbi:hypothetical protein [uncultured Flavobacterium sp.]|uniref:hypothetical protein n=1 Tax=uncultured Flavobacterium sp. TaxID=165435 RepID=UPI0030ED56D5|tara:strand:+ start:169 stop:555 length:387 start_codon:yes stop_codon:yes gene_type:complete
MKKILLLCAMVIMSSCASKLVFPVSNVAPAAEITVKIKKDDNGNREINLNSKYLSSPDRLTPPRASYIVWMQTEANGLLNLGQLETDASEKGSFTTVTAYEPLEIFITAEDDIAIKYPTGQEISRVKI